MNNYFSFHRIKLLVIRYVAEHGRRDIITLSAFFMTIAFLPRLTGDTGFPFLLFCLLLGVGGIRFTARIFHEIHHPATGMHYLHIPASRLEKFLLNWTLTLFCYPAICLLLYYGGTLFGNLIEPLIPSFLYYRTIDISSLFPKTGFEKLIWQYLFCHTFFFLGSLIFKKHPTTKTIVSLILFGIGISIFEVIMAKLLWGGSGDISITFDHDKFRLLTTTVTEEAVLLKWLNYLLSAIVVLFFWTVSYFKLKEKQV